MLEWTVPFWVWLTTFISWFVMFGLWVYALTQLKRAELRNRYGLAPLGVAPPHHDLDRR